MNEKLEEKIIVKTSFMIMVWNIILSILKVFAGIVGRSSAMISDAINSISDVLTNLVVMISGKFSRKAKDDEHPYGHEKLDSMVSILLGVAIIITAFEIGKAAFTKIIGIINQTAIPEPPTYVALIAALLTILVKEGLFHYTKKNALKAHSSALNAQAYDHRSDQLASFGAVIGITGALLGVIILEPIASVVICLFILRVGFKIITEGFGQVVDKSCDKESIEKIITIVKSNPEVKRLDDLKTRMFGMKMYVDIEIAVDRKLSLLEAHKIAEDLHDLIEAEMPEVKHCMIHVNPYQK